MLSMRTIDNQNPNYINNNDTETYKIPTPADVKKSLTKTAVLGEHFESEEDYMVPPSDEVRKFAERKATVGFREDDEKPATSELDGFTVKDATQMENESGEDIDEVPEDLDIDLGEPDDDEVKEVDAEEKE